MPNSLRAPQLKRSHLFIYYYVVLSRLEKLEYIFETYIKIMRLSLRRVIFGFHLFFQEIVITVTHTVIGQHSTRIYDLSRVCPVPLTI